MLILGLETSCLQGSVAIARIESSQFELLFLKAWKRQRSHGELVTSTIEDALSTLKISLDDIDLFALDTGPGSFTGIRVGLSVIRTLAYATSKPVVAVSSLDILAHQVPKLTLPVVTLVNAHKNQNYVATFEYKKKGWAYKIKPQAMTIEKLEKTICKKHICIGDGYSVFAPVLSKGLTSRLLRDSACLDYPLASTLVHMASVGKYRSVSWKDLQPLYIRGSEAEEKLQGGTLKPLPEF